MGEDKIIKIGGHPVEVWYTINSEGEPEYFAELYADGTFPNKDTFYITFLNDVSCKDLPDSLLLIISYTRSEFRKVNFVKIQKKEGICKLEVTLALNYQDWEMAESIGSFVYRFIDSIKNNLNMEAKPVKTEYGYFVECSSLKSDVNDMYEWYSEIEHSLEKVYQRELVNPPKSGDSTKKYGENRLHWWIRYVIVPLIGSGTIAAVIGKYLLQ